jgi:hypothetical protein
MTEVTDPVQRLIDSNERLLIELKKRYKGNTAEDVKKILQHEIDEMTDKIKRLKAKL